MIYSLILFDIAAYTATTDYVPTAADKPATTVSAATATNADESSKNQSDQNHEIVCFVVVG